MPDIKIFIAALAWITVAVFIIANAGDNYSLADERINFTPTSVNSGTVHINNSNNVNTTVLGLEILRGNWTINNDGLMCNGLDFLSGHATAKFGSKKFIGFKYGEAFRFTNMSYNNTALGDAKTDELSINVFNSGYGSLEIRIISGVIYLAYTYNIIDGISQYFVNWNLQESDFTVQDGKDNSFYIAYEINFSQHIYGQYGVMDIYTWHDGEAPYKIGTSTTANYIIQKYIADYGADDALKHIVFDLSKSSKSRIDTNIMNLTVTDFEKYRNVTINPVTLKQYNMLNPQGTYDNVIAALTFQVDSRIIPIEYQFFLIGIPYIMMAIWIIMFLKELTQV